MKKFLLFLMFCFIFVGLVQAETETAPQPMQNGQDQKIQGFNLQGYTENGDKSWDVNGDTADFKGQEVVISNVDANSYGDQKVNVTAEKGYVNQTTGTMRLEKDVVVTSQEGSQLLTDTLNWDRNKNEVSTEDKVFIKDERFTASGKGMEAQTGLKNAKIKEDVTVMVNSEKEKINSKIVTVTSDGPMVIDQAKSVATFTDNVQAVQDNQTLNADKMEVFFLPDMKGIKKIICTGNVVIVQGENKTFAEVATYDSVNQKIILSGRPKLVLLTEGDNAITTLGDEESR